MKVIIAGSRTINSFHAVRFAISASKFHITEVVSGKQKKGVDRLGEVYAIMFNIPTTFFPADWRRYGKQAGPIRNREMASYADGLIAIWDGKSRGTKNMIEEAKKRGLQTFVYIPMIDLQRSEA